MCDIAVVVEPGRVWFAKSSDRDANEAQYLEHHPARIHAADAKVRCTHIAIPQVRHTHAVLLSRPFWMWGAEMGTNVHGVTIGNTAVFTREPMERTGLTGMDLVRLALERAATAREAADVIRELLEQHGQGGGCGHEHPTMRYHNAFVIADGHGALVLETANDRWALEEVRGARTVSNGLTIAGFTEQHSDRLKTHFSRCRRRRGRTRVLAESACGVADMMRLLRDHGEGRAGPAYDRLTGALDAPCAHPAGLLASTLSTASWVAELGPEGARHWATATSAPCTSLFKPVSVEAPVRVGQPIDRADADSLWWRHERLHRRVMRNPEALLPLFAPERDAIEQRWLASPPTPEQAFAEGDDALARWTARVAAARAPDVRPGWVRRYWRRRNRRAGLSLETGESGAGHATGAGGAIP